MVNRPKVLPSAESIAAYRAAQGEKAKMELDNILRRLSLRKELQSAVGYLIRKPNKTVSVLRYIGSLYSHTLF